MKKQFKSKFISFLAILLVAVFSLSFGTSLSKTSADSYPKEIDLITNNKFTSYTGSSQPYTPNSWETINPESISGVKAGVISTSTWKPEDIGLTDADNPGKPSTSTDSYLNTNLFINAESNSIYYGYKSNTFKLDANSYYQINIMLQTAKGGHASIKINGLGTKAIINNITTKAKTWTEYSIFIQTGEDDLSDLTIELMLGNEDATSTGAVFFNSVIVRQHSATTYALQCPSTPTATQLVIDLKHEGPITLPFTNAGFDEGTIDGWTVSASETGTSATAISSTLADTVDYNNIKAPGLINNPHILYLNNTDSAWQKITSPYFTIPGNSFIRLSFWARTNIAGAQVNVKNKNGDSLGDVSISTASGYNINNKWKQYNIVIEGNIGDEEIAIEIIFGTEESKLTGYLGIDNFTTQSLSRSTFTKGGDESISLKPTAKTDKYVIKNGTFSKIDKELYDTLAPFVPISWTYFASDSREELNGTHGVIDSNSSIFTHPLGHTMTNPPTHAGDISTVHNNMLMIYNQANDTQGYKTTDYFSLSGNTYYEIYFYVNTTCLGEGGAYVKMYSVDKNIEYFSLSNIDTEGSWQKYTIYIRVGSEALDLKLELGMVNQGICFFDNVISRTSLESLYNDAEVSDNTFKINLYDEDFSVRPYDKKGETSDTLYNASTWESVTKSGATPIYGILNLANELQKTALGLEGLAKSKNNNVFVIKSALDTYFSTTSKNIISLKENSYYKITVNLATKGLSTITGKDKFGAFISLTGFEDVLNNINTNGEYEEFTIYVTSDKSKTTALCFGLGQPESICSGTVLCDSIKVETTTKSDYESAEGENSLKLSFVGQTTDNSDNDSEDTKTKTPFNPATLWAIIPSALFGIVVIIAVVVILVRKSKLPKKVKNQVKKARTTNVNPTYDRKKAQQFKTSPKDQININEKEIFVLKNKIAEIEGQLGQLETEHQEAVEKIKEEHKKVVKVKKTELDELINAKKAKEEEFKSTKRSAKEEKEFAKDMVAKDKEIASLQKFIETSKPNLKDEKIAYESKKASKRSDKSTLEARVNVLTEENEKLKNPIKK